MGTYLYHQMFSILRGIAVAENVGKVKVSDLKRNRADRRRLAQISLDTGVKMFILHGRDSDGLLVVYLADSASTRPSLRKLSANVLKIAHAIYDRVRTTCRVPVPETRKKSCSVLPVSQQATAYSVGHGCSSSDQRVNAGEKTGVYLA